ncbi:DUF1266 domain-containing protein [Wukongibacter baidiensis]|uniref:DUF1266 domain-containing protein n=1 Tax=Wukongibacter baidiensis TaxID=1723361 RepID=UPI003D7FDA79
MNRNKRGFITILLIAFLFFTYLPINVEHTYAESYTYNVFLNGHLVNAYRPSFIADETMATVPLKPFCDSLDAKVEWDENTKSILVSKDDIKITLQVDSDIAKGNDKEVEIGTEITTLLDKTMVPVNLIGDILGLKVTIDEETSTIIIESTKIEDKQDYSKEQLEWGLATDAILVKMNNGRYDLIGMEEPTEYNIERTKIALSESWDINSREDALSSIKWLKESGHRKTYNRMVFYTTKISEEAYSRLLSGLDEEEIEEYEFVKEHHKKIGDKSLIAWDYCRLVHIVGSCYKIGYLEYDEAVKEIMEAAIILQNTFSSWNEMSENYAWGRYFWGGEESYKQVNTFKDWLLVNERSPWTKIDWNLPLK